MLRLQHALHTGERSVIDLDEIRIMEIDRRPVERTQHAVRDVRRPRVGEELAAAEFRDSGAHALILMVPAGASIAENAGL
jgi:hypothetical protein